MRQMREPRLTLGVDDPHGHHRYTLPQSRYDAVANDINDWARAAKLGDRDRSGRANLRARSSSPGIAVGMPVTEHPPQSGRIEARTGLRMMPTSPRSPLSFRTPVFPSTAGRMAFRTAPSQHVAQLKPAPGMRWPRIGLLPPSCIAFVSTNTRRVGYAPMHRRGGWVTSSPGVLARVRVVLSRSVIT